MKILTKKINNLLLEDMYIYRDIEGMQRKKPMKMGMPLLNPLNP